MIVEPGAATRSVDDRGQVDLDWALEVRYSNLMSTKEDERGAAADLSSTDSVRLSVTSSRHYTSRIVR
jgi:hypothetical protein